MENYADLMFTEAVAGLQEAAGSRERYQTLYPHRTTEVLGGQERTFIEARQSFYIASINSDGWPYIQHRGGPAGFLKVVGPTRVACADYKGNRQYITQGNLATETRVSVFLMDYLNKARLKMQGHARLTPISDADPEVARALDLAPPAERVLVIDLVAIDWNCPQFIPDLYPAAVAQDAVARATRALSEEIAALKQELQRRDGA
ncbi:MAG: pyridoxamine 5'-phosphate oxidase family protein [Pseudomonadota bacterium]